MKIFLKEFIILLIIIQINTLFLLAQSSIILKVKPIYKSYCTKNNINLPSFQTLLQQKSYKLTQLFPDSYFPTDTSDIFYSYCVDISTIYELSLIDEQNINDFIKKIAQLPEIEYCHEKHYPELLFTTNDPAIFSQYYLTNVQAFGAWDIYKGDSTIVIGIVDTGTEIAHDDLWQNLAYNIHDPIDGVDNDSDGYIDNYWGWDLGNNDNSPEWSNNTFGANAHGVFVAGMAAPTTNNGIGISGVGFKTRYLPVKINDSTGVLSKSYEGIVYAADHGCKIINCSWGSTIPDDFGYDIVKYATYNRKCLVVAAAGNNGNTTNDVYYPAAYDEVMCVAATNQQDKKWSKSCYGYHVDVSSPGENVYSTYANNGYTYGWGTSYASPLAASVAALAYGYYQKQLNPFQLRAIVEKTSDNIDTIADNQPFEGKIGKGRVNALNALQQKIKKSARPFNYQFLESNDTIYLSCSLINLFAPTNDLFLKITSSSSYIQILTDSIYIGELDSLQIINNLMVLLKVLPNCPFNSTIDLFFIVKDSLLDESYHISATINKNYYTLQNGVVLVTACSNGRIGYNSLYPVQGDGVKAYNQSLVAEMGLWVYADNKASWCFGGHNDFQALNKISVSSTADSIVAFSSLNDSNSSTSLQLSIQQWLTLYYQQNKTDFIRFNYLIKNTSGTTYDSLFVGLFSDIDILNPIRNKIEYDSLLKILYAYMPASNGIHVAFYMPLKIKGNFYAVDNDGQNNSISINDGVSLSELKQIANNSRLTAGGVSGNDVSVFVSSAPIRLLPNDSVELSFFMIFGRNKNELWQNVQHVIAAFDTIIHISEQTIGGSPVIFPNPSDGKFRIKVNEQSLPFLIEIYDIERKLIDKRICLSSEICYDKKLSSGLYLLKVSTTTNIHWIKLIVN